MRQAHLREAAFVIVLVCVCGVVSAQQSPIAAPPHPNPNQTLR